MTLKPIFESEQNEEDLGKCPIHGTRLTKSIVTGEPSCPKCSLQKLQELGRQFDLKMSRQLSQNYLEKWSLTDDSLAFDSSFFGYKAIPGSKEDQLGKKMLENAKAFVQHPDAQKTIVLSGPPGTGKTYLAMSLLKYVQQNSDQKCLFMNMNTVLRHIKNSFENPHEFWTQTMAIRKMRNADLLCIDDLGTESAMSNTGQATNFVQNILYEVLNVQGRVVITTNLTEDQMKLVYNAKNVSRIFNNSRGTVYDFTGIADHRYRY